MKYVSKKFILAYYGKEFVPESTGISAEIWPIGELDKQIELVTGVRGRCKPETKPIPGLFRKELVLQYFHITNSVFYGRIKSKEVRKSRPGYVSVEAFRDLSLIYNPIGLPDGQGAEWEHFRAFLAEGAMTDDERQMQIEKDIFG